MKRYELTRGFDGLMNEEDHGEWVKYSDVEKEMKRIWSDIMPPPGDILKTLIKGG